MQCTAWLGGDVQVSVQLRLTLMQATVMRLSESGQGAAAERARIDRDSLLAQLSSYGFLRLVLPRRRWRQLALRRWAVRR
jgi:hypothetical protein